MSTLRKKSFFNIVLPGQNARHQLVVLLSIGFASTTAIAVAPFMQLRAGNGSGGPGAGTNLIRHWITSPSALCNDGTPAAAYVQQATSLANQNDWVIFLEGGGSCQSEQECADRWQGTASANYGIQKMSTSVPRTQWNFWRGLPLAAISAPTGWERQTINGVDVYAAREAIASPGGIFSGAAANPFATWNKVYLNYCSSDAWLGQNSGLTGFVSDKNGTPAVRAPNTQFTLAIQFRGADIFDGLIDNLRTGVSACTTSALPVCQTLPSLNSATTILLAGSSAGSRGVQYNLDRFRQGQSTNNVNTVVRGIFDAGSGPDAQAFPYSTVLSGFADYHAQMDYEWNQVMRRLWNARNDESCELLNVDQPARCADKTHLQRHHITTSFFTRTDQLDPLPYGEIRAKFYPDAAIGGSYPASMAGFKQSVGTVLNLQQIRDQRDQLLPRHPTELAAVAADVQWLPPGVFAPRCGNHEGLLASTTYFNQPLTVAGVPTSYVAGISAWLASGSFAAYAPVGSVPLALPSCP
jgi:Pectinacetylesterase